MSFAFPHLQYNPNHFPRDKEKGRLTLNHFPRVEEKGHSHKEKGVSLKENGLFLKELRNWFLQKHPFFEIREISTGIQYFSIGNPRAEAAQPATSLF